MSATPPSSGGAHVASAAASTSGRDVDDRDRVAGGVEQLDIVGRVTDRDRVCERVTEPLADDLAADGLAHVGVEESPRTPGSTCVTRALAASSRVITAMARSTSARSSMTQAALVVPRCEQRLEVRHQPEWHPADPRVQPRLGTILLAEQLVVLVRLEVPVLLAGDVQCTSRRCRAERLLEDRHDRASRPPEACSRTIAP